VKKGNRGRKRITLRESAPKSVADGLLQRFGVNAVKRYHKKQHVDQEARRKDREETEEERETPRHEEEEEGKSGEDNERKGEKRRPDGPDAAQSREELKEDETCYRGQVNEKVVEVALAHKGRARGHKSSALPHVGRGNLITLFFRHAPHTISAVFPICRAKAPEKAAKTRVSPSIEATETNVGLIAEVGKW